MSGTEPAKLSNVAFSTPRRIIATPSVAMNGFTRSQVMTTPLASPATAPAASAAATPSGTRPGEPAIVTDVTIADTLTTYATERSIEPASTTSACPTVTSPSATDRCAMFWRFATVTKWPPSTPTTIQAARNAAANVSHTGALVPPGRSERRTRGRSASAGNVLMWTVPSPAASRPPRSHPPAGHPRWNRCA